MERILIVDDNVDNAISLGQLIHLSFKKQTRSVFSGADAIRIAEEFAPDCVLIDFQLPDMNGSEAAREIKARIPGAVIIGMSGHPRESIFDVEAFADFWLKPTAFDTLQHFFKDKTR